MTVASNAALIAQMNALDSAEAFLDFFALPYDKAVVNVSRLHILKRFNQYLAQKGGIDSLPPARAFSICRELLARAYTDFLTSSGIEQKVFRVFQAAQGRQTFPVSAIGRVAA